MKFFGLKNSQSIGCLMALAAATVYPPPIIAKNHHEVIDDKGVALQRSVFEVVDYISVPFARVVANPLDFRDKKVRLSGYLMGDIPRGQYRMFPSSDAAKYGIGIESVALNLSESLIVHEDVISLLVGSFVYVIGDFSIINYRGDGIFEYYMRNVDTVMKLEEVAQPGPPPSSSP